MPNDLLPSALQESSSPDSLLPSALSPSTRMREARQRFEDYDQEPAEFIGRRLPFMSTFLAAGVDAARQRIAEGRPEANDFQAVARHERIGQIEQERGYAGQLGASLASVPGMVGEMALGGAALRGVGLAGEGASVLGNLFRGHVGTAIRAIPGAAVRNVPATLSMPGMFVPGAAENAREGGGTWTDLRNLAPAMGMGYMQTAILGSLSDAGKVVSGPGISRFLARQGIRGVTGAAEQSLADLLGGVAHLQTGYGPLGEVWHGRAGEALQHASITAATFAAFGLIYEGHGDPGVMETAARTLREAHRQGLSPDGAARALEQVIQPAINEHLNAQQPANAPESPQTSAAPPPAQEPTSAAEVSPAAAVARPAESQAAAPEPAQTADPNRQRWESIPLKDLQAVYSSLFTSGKGVKKPPADQAALVSGIVDNGGQGFLDALAPPPRPPEPAAPVTPPVSETPSAEPAPPAEPPQPVTGNQAASEPESPQPQAVQSEPPVASPRELHRMIDKAEGIGTLSGDQANLLRERLDGRSLKDIAKEGGVSKSAIHKRQKAALDKLGVPADAIETALDAIRDREESLLRRKSKGTTNEGMTRPSNDLGVEKTGIDALATQMLEAIENGDERLYQELVARADQGTPSGTGSGSEAPRPDAATPRPQAQTPGPQDAAGQQPQAPVSGDAGAAADVMPSAARVTPGGGQENAGPAKGKPITTALANEITESERRLGQLAEIEKAARVGNEQVWEAAKRQAEADPASVDRVIADLSANPRPASVAEDALLLHRRITLTKNIQPIATRTMETAFAVKRAKKAGAGEAELARLQDADRQAQSAFDGMQEQIDKLDRVIVATGTEQGRALQFRKQLAAMDYSLAGMLQRAAVAKGERLTPEEMEKFKTLQAQLDTLQAALEAKEKALAEALKNRGDKSALDVPEQQEHQAAVIEVAKTKQKVDQAIAGFRWENKTTIQKVLDWLRRIRLFQVISSPVTAGKIAVSSATETARGTVDSLIGEGLKNVPGIAPIAAQAPIEGAGFNSAREAASLKAAGTKGFQDAKDILRTNQSALDLAYGPRSDTPYTWIDFFGALHSAEKAPAVRADFERSFRAIEASERAAGREVTSPAAVEAIGQRAYEHSKRAKFQQDNRVVDGFNRWVDGLKRSDSGGARTIGHLADLLLPVRRTPTNIIADVLEHVGGLPVGLIRAMRHSGTEIPRPVAESIMRQLKRGSLGLPLLALGWYFSSSLGGLYSGKRTEEEGETGEMNIGGIKIPGWAAAHHPALMALHVGAGMRRAWNAQTREPVALHEAAGKTFGALLDEVPFVREQAAIGEQLQGRGFGAMVRSFTVPQLIQFAATVTDREEGGGPQQRKPGGVGENIMSGIPVARQQVPAGPPRAVADFILEHGRLGQMRQGANQRGDEFAQEWRYRQMDRIHQRVMRLEHQINGMRQTSHGLRPTGERPSPEEVRALRREQEEWAREALQLRE